MAMAIASKQHVFQTSVIFRHTLLLDFTAPINPVGYIMADTHQHMADAGAVGC
jgi:hypothetical protein